MASCGRKMGRTEEVEGIMHRLLWGITSCRRRGACGRCENAQVVSLLSDLGVGPWCTSKPRPRQLPVAAVVSPDVAWQSAR